MEYSSLTDEERSELLKTEQDDMKRLRIIRSFSNDDLIIQYGYLIKEEESRSCITYSLSKLENKLKIIETLTNEKWITAATLELPSNEWKIKLLGRVKSGYYKNMIIRSIKGNDIEIINALENVEDEKDKALIITRLTDDNLKLKYLEEIKDDLN